MRGRRGGWFVHCFIGFKIGGNGVGDGMDEWIGW